MVLLGTVLYTVTGIRQQGARELITARYGCNNMAETNQISCWVESEVCPAHLHIQWVVCPCGSFISPSFILMKCPDVLYFTSVQNEQSKVLALNLLWSMTQVPRGHGRKWWIPKRGNWRGKCQLILNRRLCSLAGSEWVCSSGNLMWIHRSKQLWALSVCSWNLYRTQRKMLRRNRLSESCTYLQ